MCPYRLKMLQEIKPTDKVLRLHFANWLLDNQELLDNIMWTEECHFYMNGVINTKNCLIWSTENTRAYLTKPLHSEEVTVWMGISKNFSCRPFFFDDTVNGERYLSMLKKRFFLELRRKKSSNNDLYAG